MEGTSPVPFKLTTIPSGDAGVAATLRHMVDMVLNYRANPTVRLTAQNLVRGCPERDRACHLRTLQAFVGTPSRTCRTCGTWKRCSHRT